MTHIRTQIRAAVEAALTGLPTTGANLYQDPKRAFKASDPALAILISSDAVTEGDKSGKMEHEFDLDVVGVRKSSANILDDLDVIAVEVEEVMLPNILAGLGFDLELDRTDIDTNVEGAEDIGIIDLKYTATYIIENGKPQIPAT